MSFELTNLTSENYFSIESNNKYMSVSQYKSFTECEAKALAEMSGDWEMKKTIPLLVGSYVDAHFEGTLDLFKAKNPEIFTTKLIENDFTVAKFLEVGGGYVTRNNTLVSKRIKEAKETHPEFFTLQSELKADFKQAEEIIQRIERDKLFMDYMAGEKQTIFTAELFGCKWKIKIDSYFPDDKIVDLKCMRSLDRIMGISLVEHWQYDLQMAVYSEIERRAKLRERGLPTYLAIATKEDVTNLEIVHVPEYQRDERLEEVAKHMPRILSVKEGREKPIRCGVCDYCKYTKVLTEPIEADLLGFSEKEVSLINGEIY